MKKVRNLLLTVVLVLMSVGCCVLMACKDEAPTNYRGLNFGKYYLENSEDVYIEIKADHKAYLHNLDFSDFDPEEYWGHSPLWKKQKLTKENVVTWMQGEREYHYFDDKIVSFFIRINDEYGAFSLGYKYNGTDQLSFDDNSTYILRK